MTKRWLGLGLVSFVASVAACLGEDPGNTATSEPGSDASADGSSNATVAPGAPTNALAVANVAKGATVSWAAPAQGAQTVTEYTITSKPGGVVAKAAANATSTVVTGLTPGQSYTFDVTATNPIGTGPAASTNSVTVVDQSSPVLDSVCPGDKGFIPFFGTVPADSYNLYYASSPGVSLTNGTKIPNVTNGSPALNDVAPGTYHVVVTSVKGAIESLPSTEVAVEVTARAKLVDTLFMTRSIKIGEGGIHVIEEASTTANHTGTKTVHGANTGLVGVEEGIWADKATAMLYVLRQGSIGVWHDAGVIADGDVAPSRAISGSSTTLGSGRALLVDRTRNILYAAVNGANAGEHRILAWKNACNVKGNVAPTATIKINTTTNFYDDLALDEVHDRLYVASSSTASARVVFAVDGASTKNGSIDATKAFSIAGVPNSNALNSVAYDDVNDYLFVGSNAYQSGTAWRFNQPYALQGPTISPAISVHNNYTMPIYRITTGGGVLFIKRAVEIFRWPDAKSYSGAEPQGLPDNFLYSTDIAGQTDKSLGGVAYVK